MGQETSEVRTTTHVKSVLIFDRNVQEGATIRNSLEGCRYDVSLWTRLEDAREAFLARLYDLVVISTNLGKDLDIFLNELRPRRMPPKVILIVDEDEGDAAARCFLKFVAVVNRPVSLAEMADLAEHLIGPSH